MEAQLSAEPEPEPEILLIKIKEEESDFEDYETPVESSGTDGVELEGNHEGCLEPSPVCLKEGFHELGIFQIETEKEEMGSNGGSPEPQPEMLQIKKEEPDPEDHQTPMESLAAPLTDGGYLQTVPKAEAGCDSEKYLPPVRRGLGSLPSAGSPEPQPEILQIKIKEEEPDPEDHQTPMEILKVKITEGNADPCDEGTCDAETPRAPHGPQRPPVRGASYQRNGLGLAKQQLQGAGMVSVRPGVGTNPMCGSGPRYETRAASSKSQGFICNKCGKMFSSSRDLLTHLCARTSHRGNKATDLGRESNNNNYDVTPTGEFCCKECGKSFSYKMGVIKHAKVHSGEKPFPCPECGKCFTLKCNLQKHLKIHSGEKPFTCPECGKSFTQKAGLQVHQNMHAGVKPFICTECGRSFPKKSTLQKHGKIHTVERTCTRCGKSVTQRRSHDGQAEEKPFTCTECEKKINYMKELPYKCTECGDSFFHNSHLVIHRKVHEREKPFRCKECGEAFSKRKPLKKHRRLHHGCSTEGPGGPGNIGTACEGGT
eukprot:XP_017950573.1 PREDICTED: gastrula zinc finger protein 5-1-like isoform X3 [Xenopus tropicalis]